MDLKISKEYEVSLISISKEYSLYIGCKLIQLKALVTKSDEKGNETIVKEFYFHSIELPHDIQRILINDKAAKDNPGFRELNQILYPTILQKSVDGVFIRIGEEPCLEGIILNIDGIDFSLFNFKLGFASSIDREIQFFDEVKSRLKNSNERNKLLNKLGLNQLPLGYHTLGFTEHLEFLCALEIDMIGLFLWDEKKLRFSKLYPEYIKMNDQFNDQILNEMAHKVIAVMNNSTALNLNKIYVLSDTKQSENGLFETETSTPTTLKEIFLKADKIYFAETILNDESLSISHISIRLGQGLNKLNALDHFVVIKLHELGSPLFLTLAWLNGILTTAQVIDYLSHDRTIDKVGIEEIMWNTSMINTFRSILKSFRSNN